LTLARLLQAATVVLFSATGNWLLISVGCSLLTSRIPKRDYYFSYTHNVYSIQVPPVAVELGATLLEDVGVGPATELELDPPPLAPDLSTTADTI